MPPPPGVAEGATANFALPLPTVTLRPATMPIAAPKATSLRKCRLSWMREAATVTIALGSVGLGVLVAATAGELATIVAWVVIAVVNVAHARRR